MNKTSNNLIQKAFLLSVLCTLTLLFSCKKDGELSPDFDNGNLAISFVDTFSITTSLTTEDSLRTDGLLLNMVGLYNDPIFGPVSSSFYTQVLLTGVDVDFGLNSGEVDSVVLTLEYAGLHGNTASQMAIDVYELNTDLDFTTDYYSTSENGFNPTPLASMNFTPNLTDSVNIDFDTIQRVPHLRVKLNKTFGDGILTASSSDLTDDASFKSFMKGFYITTNETVNSTSLNASEGSIAYFNMNSDLSTLTLYYDDTSSYSFTINPATEKYSHFEQNYSGTDVEKHLTNDASRETSKTYVSSMSGVKTKIELPTIQELGNGGPIVINKAEIVFNVDPNTITTNDVIDKTLYLVGIDSDGNQVVLPDNNSVIELDPSHFGGTYDEITESYTFNITRHLHEIINSNSPDYGMYLVSRSATTEANRAVIGSGEKNGVYKMRLEITYSKI
ncbi:DUF4270 domain-containing protein [Vicingaceae bacterium]|jgi:hypothetical protein|nr:DUF4270 domain-containing protein [Vicingaceae bacterium]